MCSWSPLGSHPLLEQAEQGTKILEQLRLNQVDFDHGDPKDFFHAVRDLSQNCGTTLYLSPEYYTFISEWQVTAISEDFKEKKVKKIVCTMNKEYAPVPYLTLLTDELIVMAHNC